MPAPDMQIIGSVEGFAAPELDVSAQLEASIASLSAAIDKANLRLDLTRAMLKSLIGNDFAYMQILAAIDGAVREGVSVAEFEAMIAEDDE